MRQIAVSTKVFAAIWANHIEPEKTENEILERILIGRAELDQPSRPPKDPPLADTYAVLESENLPEGTGVRDDRNGLQFDQGFEAFRFYKGERYVAVASSGQWHRPDTGERFATLNQLNASIVSGAENIWNGTWKYRDETEEVHPLSNLRRDLSGSSEPEGTIEHDFWKMIHEFERSLSEKNGRATRMSRTRQKVRSVGVISTLSQWAVGPPTPGFKMLHELERLDLTGEAIILRHPGGFPDHVVEAAKRRLRGVGYGGAQ